MSGLVFACVAPHGGIIIPALAGEAGQKALATRAAIEELGRRMAACQPETVVLVTPHGYRVDGFFSLLNNRRVQGKLGPEIGGNENSISLVFEVDKELNTAIIDAARSLEVPVTRISYAVPDDPTYFLPVDWGATIPLWFLGGMFYPQPRVVIACPDRSNIPWELSAPFGLSIRKAAETLGRRIAFVASADLGHAHDKDGPYGFDPASAEFDAATLEAVKAQDLGRLLTFDQAWLKRAATDAYGQILKNPARMTGVSVEKTTSENGRIIL